MTSNSPATLYRLLNISGLEFYLHAEGSWPDAEGINENVGSFFGVNGDAGGNRSLDITEVWFQKSLLENSLLLRLGKIDLTGGFECSGCPVAFDSSSFANDETTQFVNGALVNNPTIPFPDYALAAAVLYKLSPQFYVAGAAADAQGDLRETGFNTAFHNEDYFLYIAEMGFLSRIPGGLSATDDSLILGTRLQMTF